MAMTPAQRTAVLEAAERSGVDPEAAIAEAEAFLSETSASVTALPSGTAGSASDTPRDDGRPLAERLLIGMFPFILVKELRSLWLGLPDAIPDDGLTCGEFQLKIQAKYGVGGASSGASDE